LQHIVGYTEFAGLRLRTDARALIPRPETEFLVETVAARAEPAPLRILDLGTGSGAIALALALRFPLARVTAVDSSLEALSLAEENAALTGHAGRVTFARSDWFASIAPGEAFDLIVSNPPYLSGEEAAAAAPEVRAHEPPAALTSQDGGFADIAAIAGAAAAFLAPGGMLALETGTGHHPRLAELLAKSGFARSESLPDLAGRSRFVLAWR
jgi:release factor glutamine methyltransferase